MSHDPAKEFVTEKTTGRKLNVIDVPGGNGDGSGKTRPTVNTNVSSRHSRDIPQGRALSPGKIQHPKPSKPYASRTLREADYDHSPVDDLEERFAGYRISSDPSSASPSELSDDSSSSGTAFSRSSPSSLSSVSDHSCRCERYGVTRSGQRVKLDCGGKRCGSWSSSSSECDSAEEESSEDDREYRARQKREAERRREKEGGHGHVKERGGGGHGESRRVVVEKRR